MYIVKNENNEIVLRTSKVEYVEEFASRERNVKRIDNFSVFNRRNGNTVSLKRFHKTK